MSNEDRSCKRKKGSPSMTEKEINASNIHPIHFCKGYVEEIEQLSLSRETIERANRCGFNVVDFADSCLKTITHNVGGNSYDDMAKIVDGFGNAAILFLRKYEIKDIEVARFSSNDIEEEFTVFLSEKHGGYIIVKGDGNEKPSVRVTNGKEIWRYLPDPLHVIEAVISAIIAYAEKHQSAKDRWLFALEDVDEISRE
jgi:hypothetical protein